MHLLLIIVFTNLQGGDLVATREHLLREKTSRLSRLPAQIPKAAGVLEIYRGITYIN